MASTINTNVASLTAQRNLGMSQSSLNTSIQRLSSGLRINSAKDDAAGLAISERFTSQIRGLNQAVRNANDGISLAQTAEGALKASGDILQRVRELAVQSANASNSASDRQALQAEVGQLVSELDRISQTTEFNGTKLLDGTFGTQQFQVGANANQTIIAATGNMRTNVYGNNQNTAANGAGAAGVAAAWGVNGATAGAVAINGALGSSTVTTVVNATAKATADQINAVKSSTGVSATARTDVEVTLGAAGSYSLTLQSDNSTAVSVSFNTSGGAGLSAAVAAFNDQTSKTGVTASLNTAGTAIVLSNATGNDIHIANLDAAITNAGTASVQKLNQAGVASGAAVVVVAAGAAGNQALVSGNITLDSEKSFSITSASTALTTGGSTLNKVADLDVTTFKKASDALKTVDSALSFINGERAKLGALQSRFETSISNLQVTSENLSSSRSRILDADFAAETANLSRAQILQQAGTAMVAQANQLPQGVLSLLR
ncbi:flagellin N-terminal helical domain-containing protein [Diaphorobacter nitroreducens]|uniref:flagellin N-terminal helical domain-containing protein n=1 Tax=Diaphorobacter nitroreducens TaxID=164759 RepID=UPI0028989D3F|nr:flagellin [Diaphorobacter nitroreducens]